jgi:PPOX class probable FMN-dependent enzyme
MMKTITTIAELETLYSTAPALASTAKETDHLIPAYQKLIELSPFVALATIGEGGLDCSPRGDQQGFVRVLDPKTIAMPDRRGNNRIDSLRNIVADPRVALLFLIPGSGTTFRVNGRAVITTDDALLQSFAVEGQIPRSVIVITVETAYFQCARAILRSNLWDSSRHVSSDSVPTPGAILESLTKGEINGEAYTTNWPIRAKSTMW